MARVAMCLVATLFGVSLSGCGTTKALKSPRFTETDNGITKVGVVVAEARVIDLSGGGNLRVNLKETERCPSLLEAAAVRTLKELGYDAVPLVYDDEIRGLVTEHLRGRHELLVLWARKESIDSAPALLSAGKAAAARGVDAIAFVSVRIVDPTFRSVLGFAMFGIERKGELEASMTLVDSEGSVIYFHHLKEQTLSMPWAFPAKFYNKWCKNLSKYLPPRSP